MTARRLAPRRPNDWADLAQEGWIAMWRALQTYDPTLGAEASYLTRAAQLRMLDCLRRDAWTGTRGTRGHKRELAAVPVDPTWDWVQDSRVAVHEDLEMAYHYGEIARALDALDPDDRKWIINNIMLDGGRFSWQTRKVPRRIVDQLEGTLKSRLSHLMNLCE